MEIWWNMYQTTTHHIAELNPPRSPYALLRRFYVKTDLSERGVTFGHHGKNGSWTGPRRLWTPKPASWSRGRIQVDAKERHHQAPPCIKSRGNQGRVNLHLKAERRLKGCNPSSGDPAHKPHHSVPTSPAPSRAHKSGIHIIHCTPFWAQTPASRDTWMSWNIGNSLLMIILFLGFHY